MWESLWQWVIDPTNHRILLAVFIAFFMGLLIGVWKRRSTGGGENSTVDKADKAFFRGVQYILSNDHDHAIEEFTKSVQVNSDTIETYVALGNLYRSKGDIDRAIRIRQSIILRPHIDNKIRINALFDLGLDYRKGGFLNRALKTFLKVEEGEPSNVQVLKEIERIYEELKDWENALKTRQKISRLTKGNYKNIMAHHLVEMGKHCQQNHESTTAISLFNKAIATHSKCVDAYLHLGDVYFERQEYKKAVSSWEKVATVDPHFTFLAYRRLEGAYSEMKNLKPVEDFLKECAQKDSDAFTHLALARYLYNENDINGALDEIRSALELEPLFWEARRFKGEILLGQEREKDIVVDYRDLIKHLDMPYLRFQCEQCGFEPATLQWQCPQCKSWDTIHIIDSNRLDGGQTQRATALPEFPGHNKDK
ncbi:MAG: tetratricopeptide repeat protein [Desulfatiglans sp.]|nr:tetratricopeptide repeat protein [Desulfatiglans sp.]